MVMHFVLSFSLCTYIMNIGNTLTCDGLLLVFKKQEYFIVVIEALYPALMALNCVIE